MRTRRHASPPLRLLAALLVLGSILPTALASPSAAHADVIDEAAVREAVDGDEAVRRAREEQALARRQRAAAQNKLDEAAARYEQAWSEAERLAAEAEGLTRDYAAFEQASDHERDTAAQRAVAAYLAPSRQLSLSRLVLGADSPRTALHLAGLVGHMGRRSDAAIAELDDVQQLRGDETRQQQIVTAGAHAAADHHRIEAGRMRTALDDAAHVVSTAEETLADAESQAAERERQRQREEAERRRREEEERRRQEAARLAAAQRQRTAARADFSQAPPPKVDGRVCPIGTPNGFIDSWGFPRSGGRAHKGVDIFAPRGTPLFAVADGVADTGSNRLGGLTVWLTDTSGNRYYYAHLDTLAVTDGAAVRAGDTIGTTGTSGNAVGTPPHLHWQYHPGGGAAVNPYPLSVALCR